MDDVVPSLPRVAARPLNRARALAGAPMLAGAAPQRVRGVFSGFDFHLTPDGPKLIEINTNAGGAFYGALLDEMRWSRGEPDAKPLGYWSHLFVQHIRQDWAMAGKGMLRTVAIVDDAPGEQYLRLEFHLAARMLGEAGVVALIVDPRELSYRDGRLWREDVAIDLVYNRLTSFALARDVDRPLREALINGGAVVTPDPRTHALLACKRNLTLLSDSEFLRDAGADPRTTDVLRRAVPSTVPLTPGNANDFWAKRDEHYFKPQGGFGSRAVYDGAKLTRKTWQEIIDAGGYVAQERVAPGRVTVPGMPEMRFDLRVFAYGDTPFMRLARVYRGQTTNFRTPGGGFASVRVGATMTPASRLCSAAI
jgi:hypothetical protein